MIGWGWHSIQWGVGKKGISSRVHYLEDYKLLCMGNKEYQGHKPLEDFDNCCQHCMNIILKELNKKSMNE